MENKLPKLKAQVEYVLQYHPKSRNSDITLMVYVWRKFYKKFVLQAKDNTGRPVEIIKTESLLELPNQEALGRIRRKFQEAGLFLPTDEEVAKKRKINEQVWREYMRKHVEQQTSIDDLYKQAAREFEKQQAEIKPFIKTKKMTVPSTGGKWRIDTAIQSENHFGCLELDAYGHELKEDKELEEQIRDISFETISEMLDNPDSYGLYPTTKAFERIDREVLNLIAQERRKAKIEVYEELKPSKEFEQQTSIDDLYKQAGLQ